MEIFQRVAQARGTELDFDTVKAGSDEVKVMNWEYFMIAMTYIAECHMYNEEIDFSKLSVAK